VLRAAPSKPRQPIFVATTKRSRLPRIARPSSSSL
jgi:hypothetical protein